jgi:hypothetical protein
MLDRQWTVFEGRQNTHRGAEGEVRVTLGRSGVFYLNRKAYEVLGGAKAVEMLFDGNKRIVGLRPVDPAQRNAFVIKAHSRNNYRIQAAPFCRHLKLNAESTLLFDAAELTTEGILELPMDKTVSVGRGSR